MAITPAANSNSSENPRVAKPGISNSERKYNRLSWAGVDGRMRARTDKEVAQAPGREETSMKQILDMPPEVLSEIAVHLSPADLLSLARSNKCFRNIFTSRSSRHMWQAAFQNLPELPECPPSLSELNYASLLFSGICSSCGAKVLHLMDPFLHVRLCGTCRKEQIIRVYRYEDLYWAVPRSDVIEPTGRSFRFTLLGELEKARERRKDKQAFSALWWETRFEELENLQKHGERLKECLIKTEFSRRGGARRYEQGAEQGGCAFFSDNTAQS
ncbi:hypothetical protein FRC12_017746 [Ceratobasidium sp. 428]|nr:hypothetical protein FRC12_017746 [Ceratobasidium sp. 428]